MAELLGATEALFNTDFAIMNALQERSAGSSPGGFAGSTIGGVSAMCGTKYANVSARAERWSARPDFDNSWEDIDELPFLAAQGGGTLRLYGFDSPPEDGLDLDNFGMGRVIVMARGRHRYAYSDHDNDDLPPEEWLLQFFPEDGPARPLDGPPRRLAGSSPFPSGPITGWSAAMHAWHQTGWYSKLFMAPGFAAVYSGLYRSGHGVTAQTLAAASVSQIRRRANEPAFNGNNPLDAPVGPPIQFEDFLARIAQADTNTLGQVIDAMRKIDLLLAIERDGQELLIPNPDPGFVWERVPLTEREIVAMRQQIGYADFRQIADDLENALRWVADSGLETTIRQLALRWSTSAPTVRGGLSLLEATGALRSSWTGSEAETGNDDAPIFLTTYRG